MENRRNEPNLKLINMEQVEIEKIDWLLYPFIPFGKVTIVQGDPGEGKTTMVLQIIAKLTKGEAVLPSGSDEPALEEKNNGSGAGKCNLSDCRGWIGRYH